MYTKDYLKIAKNYFTTYHTFPITELDKNHGKPSIMKNNSYPCRNTTRGQVGFNLLPCNFNNILSTSWR